MNKYGTAFLISNELKFDNLQCDTEGRIMSVNVGSTTIFNGYLHCGNDRLMKANREQTIAETIPNMLQNSRDSGLFLADWNCITDVKDATRNQNEKISPSLKRLIASMKWSDVFRQLYPSAQIYSRYYSNAAYGEGATRIDRGYVYGDITILEAQYVGVALSDHMGLIVKVKMPRFCSNVVSPRASPLFKARPEVVRDPVFKARLQEQYTVWEEARTVSHIPTLA